MSFGYLEQLLANNVVVVVVMLHSGDLHRLDLVDLEVLLYDDNSRKQNRRDLKKLVYLEVLPYDDKSINLSSRDLHWLVYLGILPYDDDSINLSRPTLAGISGSFTV